MNNIGSAEEEIINVDLFGDGSRKYPLKAEYIYCDRADSCSAYKLGKCFNCKTFLGTRCQFGRVTLDFGGSNKNSKKFECVKHRAKEHEKYNTLSYPGHSYITKIGNGAFLTIPHICIECKEDGNIICKDPGFGIDKIFVSNEVLTTENSNKICSYNPCSFMGGTITRYQKEIVPFFLFQFSKLFPKQYNAFISAFPSYGELRPDFHGKIARLETLNQELEYSDIYGNKFHFEGNELVCEEYRISGFMPFGTSKHAKIRIPVSQDMTVKISDNNQVLDETILI